MKDRRSISITQHKNLLIHATLFVSIIQVSFSHLRAWCSSVLLYKRFGEHLSTLRIVSAQQFGRSGQRQILFPSGFSDNQSCQVGDFIARICRFWRIGAPSGCKKLFLVIRKFWLNSGYFMKIDFSCNGSLTVGLFSNSL